MFETQLQLTEREQYHDLLFRIASFNKEQQAEYHPLDTNGERTPSLKKPSGEITSEVLEAINSSIFDFQVICFTVGKSRQDAENDLAKFGALFQADTLEEEACQLEETADDEFQAGIAARDKRDKFLVQLRELQLQLDDAHNEVQAINMSINQKKNQAKENRVAAVHLRCGSKRNISSEIDKLTEKANGLRAEIGRIDNAFRGEKTGILLPTVKSRVWAEKHSHVDEGKKLLERFSELDDRRTELAKDLNIIRTQIQELGDSSRPEVDCFEGKPEKKDFYEMPGNSRFGSTITPTRKF